MRLLQINTEEELLGVPQSAVNRPGRIAQGRVEYLAPTSHTYQHARPRLAFVREPIRKCRCNAFRRYIGQLLFRAGYMRRQGLLSDVFTAISPIAEHLWFRGVKCTEVSIDNCGEGLPADQLRFKVEFLKPRQGQPRSGAYFGTLREFQQYCLFDSLSARQKR